MDIRKALHWATDTLEKNSPSMNLDAEVLLSFVLKKPKEFLFAHPEKKLTNLQLKTYQLLIARRAKHEPVAYLTGQKEFYGLDFLVSPAVLIPRPETELIIETLKHLNAKTIKQFSNLTIIDVGTGSGCIPIAISNQIRKSGLSGYLDINFYATDLSPAALKIARLNARRHGVEKQIVFLQGNLLKSLIHNSKLKIQNSQLIILANLPYLTTRQWRQTAPGIKKYEPRSALDGGYDGLKYFRELFKQIKKFNLKSKISNLQLEIDPSQAKTLRQMSKKNFPDITWEVKKDFAGRERLFVINFKKNYK